MAPKQKSRKPRFRDFPKVRSRSELSVNLFSSLVFAQKRERYAFSETLSFCWDLRPENATRSPPSASYFPSLSFPVILLGFRQKTLSTFLAFVLGLGASYRQRSAADWETSWPSAFGLSFLELAQYSKGAKSFGRCPSSHRPQLSLIWASNPALRTYSLSARRPPLGFVFVDSGSFP